jgi:transposase
MSSELANLFKTAFRSPGVDMGCFAVMTALVEELVPDELWAIVEPLLPPPPRPWYGGRRRTIPDRNCFAAIVYMTRTSIPWRLLPAQELGCGSPTTCWRRLHEWAEAGVFEALHLDLLDRLGERARLDWSRVSVDSTSLRARRGGDHIGANPVDRGKPGSKIHVVSEGGGLPLTAVETAANVNDTTMFEALLDDAPAVRTRRGGGATAPERPTRTRPTIATATGPTCADARSRGGSRGVGWSRRSGWGGIGGRSSGRCRGCRATGGWRSGGIEDQSGSLRSCCWRARWSASTGCSPTGGTAAVGVAQGSVPLPGRSVRHDVLDSDRRLPIHPTGAPGASAAVAFQVAAVPDRGEDGEDHKAADDPGQVHQQRVRRGAAERLHV